MFVAIAIAFKYSSAEFLSTYIIRIYVKGINGMNPEKFQRNSKETLKSHSKNVS